MEVDAPDSVSVVRRVKFADLWSWAGGLIDPLTWTFTPIVGSIDVMATPPVSTALQPVVERIFRGGELPLRLRFWDGSTMGPDRGGATIVVRSPMALRRIMYAPGELGFGRAYVAGDLDVEGDIYTALDLRTLMGDTRDHVEVRLDRRGMAELAKAVRRLGVLGPPPAPPLEEARLRGRLHSRERDAAAIAHHYDVGNHFYRTVLGPTMAYSCASCASSSDISGHAQ